MRQTRTLKEYIKVSVNLSKENEKELEKIIEESSYFGLNRTILINQAIKLLIEREKRKKKRKYKEKRGI